MSGMTLIGIYGASGFGREVMPLARAAAEPGSRLVFIDDNPQVPSVNGHDILTFEAFAAEPSRSRVVAIAIAASGVREKLAQRCADAGISLHPVHASNIVIMDDVEIGEGAILSPFVTLTSNIRIGRCFHANIYSYVAHDCVIGDFVTFAPGVMCNGNVHIHDHAYIGTGAVLKQGTPDKPIVIGKGAVVGMGAVVTKDVAPGVTVVGNPARPLVRN